MANSTTTASDDATTDDAASQSATDSTSATDATSGTTTTQTTSSIDDALKEIDSLKAALKKANDEAKSHRLKANELDKLKAEIEASKLSETEKLQKQLATLQSQSEQATRQLQERTVNYEVRLQAATMGIVDPDAAARLLDWTELEYDDNGSPTNVDDLLKKLLKAKPYLAGKGQAAQTSGGATNPSRSQTTAPATLSWETISKMTPQEYAARQGEIRQFMQNNPPTRYR